MAHIIFVTGTDTGVGKTHITNGLVRALTAQGRRARALKPIETGCEDVNGTLVGEDTRLHASTSGKTPAETCMQAMKLPLAPSVAARLEGKPAPQVKELVKWVRSQARGFEVVLVEGAGGLMVPLNETETTLDLILALQPAGVLLVAGDRLGVLSHVLSAQRVLHSVGLPSPVVALNRGVASSDLAVQTNHEELQRWMPAVLTVAAQADADALQPLATLLYPR